MRRTPAAIALWAVMTAACGGDADDGAAEPTAAVDDDAETAAVDDDAETAAVDDDAETAAVVCEGLRAHDNALVDAVNDAVEGIGAQAPAARAEAVLGGFDTLTSMAETFVDDVAAWPLPDVPERVALRAELEAGADASVAELRDERADFGTPAEIGDGDVAGQVGVLFNALEKAMSVLEPRINTYERTDFQQAFLDEPACRHVIQPFTID